MLNVTESFKVLLEKGWVIWGASCSCGGRWAWLKPRPSGAYEMVGCICHTDIEKYVEEYVKCEEG